MCREQCGADLFDKAAHACDVECAAADERGLSRTASQQAEDEIGAAGLAPVVVERHDVGMLEARDELRLGLEAADEFGVVGQRGTHDLDRDHPAGG